ncbi:hypothetical protein A2U01_0088038, partial [Trifolium medium]|nr:hypothetical protein [Trifolium medium]
PAPDGSADPAKIEDDNNVVDVLIGASLPVISSKRGRFLKPRRNKCPHDVTGDRTAKIILVTPTRGARRRVIVVPK